MKTNIVKKGVKFIVNKNYRFLILATKGIYDSWSDERYLKRRFKAIMGKDLNLNNPQTFNEKIQWLKLYNRNSEYIKMVDKYEAKKYVAEKIGEKYIVPTLGVWDDVDDIDFNVLPKQFVLKCTHDSGGIVICHNKHKLDIKVTKKKLKMQLKKNYYFNGREWPYKDVKPRIIAEKYMSTINDSEGINDYKLMCFNGNVKCSFVCSERYSTNGIKVTFYDINWDEMKFTRHYQKSIVEIQKPINYDKMIEFAEILSKSIPFVRVDFYEINEDLFFSELTFYPGGGFEEFDPESADEMLGNWINI